MARMHKTPRYPLGTRVTKTFRGFKDPFDGTVDQFLDESGFYHITYDDGDSEEMTEDDVERHCSSLPTTTAKHGAPPSRRGVKAATIGSQKKQLKAGASTETAGKRAKSVKRALTVTAPVEKTAPSSPLSVSASSPSRTMPLSGQENMAGTPTDDTQQLMSRRVCKLVMDDNGQEVPVSGTVSSYFPATKMYRVLYFNGRCDDMTHDEVVDCLSVSPGSVPKKRKAVESDEDAESNGNSSNTSDNKNSNGNHHTTDSNDRADPSGNSTPKKRKTSNNDSKQAALGDENRNDQNSLVEDAGGDSETLILTGMLSDSKLTSTDASIEESRALTEKGAYHVVRNVLFVISTNKSVQCATRDEQVEVLINDEIKPKKALMMFINKGGLQTLQELLNMWTQSKDTEEGVLLVLKVLAVIPGISRDAVITSQIGRKLREISRKRGTKDLNPAIPDMAAWVIRKWKEELDVSGNTGTKSEVPSSKTTDERDRPKWSRDSVSSPKDAVKQSDKHKAEGTDNTDSKKVFKKKKSNSASHLRDLMGGKTLSNGSRNVFAARSSRPLGTARRGGNSLIASLTQRNTKKTEQQHAVRNEVAIVENDTWRASRVQFGDVDTLVFSKDVAVSKLIDLSKLHNTYKRPPKSKANGKAQQQQQGEGTTPAPKDELTGKKPLRSILKKFVLPPSQAAVAMKQVTTADASSGVEQMDSMMASFSAISSLSTEEERARPLLRDSEPDDLHVLAPDESMVKFAAPPSPPRPRNTLADGSDAPIEELLADVPRPVADSVVLEVEDVMDLMVERVESFAIAEPTTPGSPITATLPEDTTQTATTPAPRVLLSSVSMSPIVSDSSPDTSPWSPPQPTSSYSLDAAAVAAPSHFPSPPPSPPSSPPPYVPSLSSLHPSSTPPPMSEPVKVDTKSTPANETLHENNTQPSG